MAKYISAEKLFTGDTVLEHQLVTCSDGIITSIEDASGRTGDHHVQYLSAGFFDTHINGGSRYYLTKDPDIRSVEDIAQSSEALGTAYTLPTLITSPMENILKGIGAVRAFMEKNENAGVVGMHLEGPFISPAKRGAHLPEHIQKPTESLLQDFIEHGNGVIRLMTIAPEVFTDQQATMLLNSGITISAGHSNATYEQAQAIFKKGIRLITHLFNAMSGFEHRAPGLTGAIFDNDDVYAPVILDGFHCDYAAGRIAYKIKKTKLFLISDALFTVNNIENFQWGNFNASFRDGIYINSEGNLSGAAICLGDAVRNAVNEVGIGLQEAVEMATVRPAAALGLSQRMGRIREGYPAVFTSFDEALQDFRVLRFNR